jgi:hypothetical protein
MAEEGSTMKKRRMRMRKKTMMMRPLASMCSEILRM